MNISVGEFVYFNIKSNDSSKILSSGSFLVTEKKKNFYKLKFWHSWVHESALITETQRKYLELTEELDNE